MKPFCVSATVKRSAWLITPAATSLYRASPGRIGRPAASADVHVLGRSALLLRLNTAPDAQTQPLAGLLGVVHLVEVAIARVKDEHVAVAARFHRGVQRNGVRARIALASVWVERDRHELLRRRNDRVGDAVGGVRPEVRVQELFRGVDRGDVRCGHRVDRCVRDVLVPGVVRREDLTAAEDGPRS